MGESPGWEGGAERAALGQQGWAGAGEVGVLFQSRQQSLEPEVVELWLVGGVDRSRGGLPASPLLSGVPCQGPGGRALIPAPRLGAKGLEAQGRGAS